jgi:hypothetical protein
MAGAWTSNGLIIDLGGVWLAGSSAPAVDAVRLRSLPVRGVGDGVRRE